MTLDDFFKETGISRSYISEFERGYRLPTVRYLKHLHDKYNVSLDYIFGSSSDMIHASEEDAPLEFGKYQADVNELLYFMYHLPPVMHGVLGYFMQYKMENDKFLKQYHPKDDEKGSR